MSQTLEIHRFKWDGVEEHQIHRFKGLLTSPVAGEKLDEPELAMCTAPFSPASRFPLQTCRAFPPSVFHASWLRTKVY